MKATPANEINGSGKVIVSLDEGEVHYKVALADNRCNCMDWLDEGLPCEHACALALRMKRRPEHLWISDMWKLETQREAYRLSLKPLELDYLVEGELLPPNIRSRSGRQQTKRKEAPKGPTRPVRTYRCSICGFSGHGKLRCRRNPEPFRPYMGGVGVGEEAEAAVIQAETAERLGSSQNRPSSSQNRSSSTHNRPSGGTDKTDKTSGRKYQPRCALLSLSTVNVQGHKPPSNGSSSPGDASPIEVGPESDSSDSSSSSDDVVPPLAPTETNTYRTPPPITPLQDVLSRTWTSPPPRIPSAPILGYTGPIEWPELSSPSETTWGVMAKRARAVLQSLEAELSKAKETLFAAQLANPQANKTVWRIESDVRFLKSRIETQRRRITNFECEAELQPYEDRHLEVIRRGRVVQHRDIYERRWRPLLEHQHQQGQEYVIQQQQQWARLLLQSPPTSPLSSARSIATPSPPPLLLAMPIRLTRKRPLELPIRLSPRKQPRVSSYNEVYISRKQLGWRQ
ncbi:hypothetical protein B0J12DRAFT_698682 [Macrophomina phaseolina]|uniref:SWIM-type domain-containing protein n=1 Tax=Macrophomina phaseolina TaxID=35725 RepID=A0ABQ8GFK6_9PEZI|nr:hypothetical protein B0J12DRAFT_698682 [Macrophomina phaseolina]